MAAKDKRRAGRVTKILEATNAPNLQITSATNLHSSPLHFAFQQNPEHLSQKVSKSQQVNLVPSEKIMLQPHHCVFSSSPFTVSSVANTPPIRIPHHLKHALEKLNPLLQTVIFPQKKDPRPLPATLFDALKAASVGLASSALPSLRTSWRQAKRSPLGLR